MGAVPLALWVLGHSVLSCEPQRANVCSCACVPGSPSMSESRVIKPPTAPLSVTVDRGDTQGGLGMLCSGGRLHQIKMIFTLFGQKFKQTALLSELGKLSTGRILFLAIQCSQKVECSRKLCKWTTMTWDPCCRTL